LAHLGAAHAATHPARHVAEQTLRVVVELRLHRLRAQRLTGGKQRRGQETCAQRGARGAVRARRGLGLLLVGGLSLGQG
jgi:hypothetical protein